MLLTIIDYLRGKILFVPLSKSSDFEKETIFQTENSYTMGDEKYLLIQKYQSRVLDNQYCTELRFKCHTLYSTSNYLGSELNIVEKCLEMNKQLGDKCLISDLKEITLYECDCGEVCLSSTKIFNHTMECDVYREILNKKASDLLNDLMKTLNIPATETVNVSPIDWTPSNRNWTRKK